MSRAALALEMFQGSRGEQLSVVLVRLQKQGRDFMPPAQVSVRAGCCFMRFVHVFTGAVCVVCSRTGIISSKMGEELLHSLAQCSFLQQ